MECIGRVCCGTKKEQSKVLFLRWWGRGEPKFFILESFENKRQAILWFLHHGQHNLCLHQCKVVPDVEFGSSIKRYECLWMCACSRNPEVSKYLRRALHLSGSEARFGGGRVKLAPYFFDWVGPYLISYGLPRVICFAKKNQTNFPRGQNGEGQKKEPTEPGIWAYKCNARRGYLESPRQPHLQISPGYSLSWCRAVDANSIIMPFRMKRRFSCVSSAATLVSTTTPGGKFRSVSFTTMLIWLWKATHSV